MSRSRADHSVGNARPPFVGVLLAAMLSVWSAPAWSQAPNGETFQPFAVKNVSAAELEQALQRLAPPGTEIVVDAKSNRILVRGPAATLQVIQNAIDSMDRPAAPAAGKSAARSNEPSLKNYPARFGDAAATAAWLRTQFSAHPDLRIAADQRTAQVLVLANPQMHAQVAQRLEQYAGPDAGSGAPAAPVATATSGSQSVKLRFNTAMQIESALVKTLGTRLTPDRSSVKGTSNYVFPVAGQRPLEVSINYQANQVAVQGTGPGVESLLRLVQALDAPKPGADESLQFVSLKNSKSGDIRRAVSAIQTGSTDAGSAQPAERLAMLFQPKPTDGDAAAAKPAAKPAEKPAEKPSERRQQAAEKLNEAGGLVGPVQIEMLDGLDVLVVRGHQRDVQQVLQVIQQIEQLSAETQPTIEVYSMQNVDSEAMGLLVNQLYSEVYSLRQGTVTITPLVKPNALLLIGRVENVRTAIELIKQLDQPVPPDAQFKIFGLKHASVASAQVTLQEFYASRGGLGTRVRIAGDARTNSLIVQASPRDMNELAELISRIDVTSSEAVNEVRIFKLENSMATDLATMLQSAITGQMMQQRAGMGGMSPYGGGQMQPGMMQQGMARPGMGMTDQKTAMLKFLTVDPKGQKLVTSGILTDVRITADVRSNALVVSAPSESMELIGALIHELDMRPAASAQIKVFTIVNADALSMTDMLQALFGQTTQQSSSQGGYGGGYGQGGYGGGGGGGFGQFGRFMPQTGAGDGESTIIPLRFAVDVRTNSIIASGSQGDLSVVEAILLRLDEGDVRNRKSTVYRLKNSPAQNVAQSINDFLRSEKQVQTQSPGLVSAFEQIEREVVVVPEIVSNSLIVSATPRFYDEIKALVEQLDRRPPMVLIQVLIAEVDLNNFDEFGVELGLQDGLLFDRSLLGGLVTQNITTTSPNGVQTTTQNILGATNTPGFNWNNQQPGNSGSTQSLSTAANTAGQALSNFSVGRTNSQLGYGGMVLSASSESVSVLIRALKECKRLDVLSRPQVMTLDNQPAFIMVGQKVPRISSTTIAETAQSQTNRIEYDNVGLILGVTPRISPDGLVVMEIDAEKSQVGPEAEGIPVSILSNQVIRQPRIDTTTAQTTVSALNGQTVILGGLITKSKTVINRRVPYLSDIPIVGKLLFSYDSHSIQRTELLIVMTPHVVESEENVESIKQIEASRMSWCLADVESMHGDIGVRGRADHWGDAETTVIYPDGREMKEKKEFGPEPVPAPSGSRAAPARKDELEKAPLPGPVLRPGANAPLPPTPAAASRPLTLPNDDAARYAPAGYPNSGANPVVPAGYQQTAPAYYQQQ